MNNLDNECLAPSDLFATTSQNSNELHTKGKLMGDFPVSIRRERPQLVVPPAEISDSPCVIR